MGTMPSEEGPSEKKSGRLRPVSKPLKRRSVPVGDILAVDREVLAALPADFLLRYEQVWLRAFGHAVGGRPSHGVVDPNVVAVARPITRTSTGQTATRGGAKAGKKLAGASDKDVIASAAALNFKRKIDAGLRKLNREMKVFLTPAKDRVGTSLGRRCTVCKRFGDDEWLYCPWDGKPMEEREA